MNRINKNWQNKVGIANQLVPACGVHYVSQAVLAVSLIYKLN